MANWLTLTGVRSLVAAGVLTAVAVAGFSTVIMHRDKLPLLLNRLGMTGAQLAEIRKEKQGSRKRREDCKANV